ncbi:MAG: BON domain-containing protein [Betaproteobacteria bacterium]
MHRLSLTFVAALVALPALQGCIPLFAGAAAGTGALIAEDRRSSGTYVDDQGIELKAGNRIYEKYRDAHVNVTSFNRVALLTGEVASPEIKTEVGTLVQEVPGVRLVQNELVVGPSSTMTARANDTYLTSKVKSRFIDQSKFQVNHVKVVTEATVVYLMGLVHKTEAQAAANVAATTGGVSRVVEVFEYID